MRSSVKSIQAQAEAQVRELLRAIEAAEGVVISTIERECEALRAGRTLAANALRLRLRDGARLYLNLARAARASMRTFNLILPGAGEMLEEQREAFAALLRVELAVLSAERAAAHSGLACAHVAAQAASAPVRMRAAPRRRRMRRRRAS